MRTLCAKNLNAPTADLQWDPWMGTVGACWDPMCVPADVGWFSRFVSASSTASTRKDSLVCCDERSVIWARIALSSRCSACTVSQLTVRTVASGRGGADVSAPPWVDMDGWLGASCGDGAGFDGCSIELSLPVAGPPRAPRLPVIPGRAFRPKLALRAASFSAPLTISGKAGKGCCVLQVA